jgi:hypothetical protein
MSRFAFALIGADRRMTDLIASTPETGVRDRAALDRLFENSGIKVVPVAVPEEAETDTPWWPTIFDFLARPAEAG